MKSLEKQLHIKHGTLLFNERFLRLLFKVSRILPEFLRYLFEYKQIV